MSEKIDCHIKIKLKKTFSDIIQSFEILFRNILKRYIYIKNKENSRVSSIPYYCLVKNRFENLMLFNTKERKYLYKTVDVSVQSDEKEK